jgi:hypothetical protein
MFVHRLCSVVLLPAALLLAAGPVIHAEEGMWTFDNPPVKQMAAKYGFTPTQAWLDHLRLASVRLNDGGSGSFVSPNGLLLTNHHVARGQLQKNSTAEHDYLRDGFYAATPDEEMKSADLEVNVLVGMKDVTGRVQGAAKGIADEAKALKAREAEIAAIEKESKEKPACAPTWFRSTRAASTGFTSTRSIRMCGWSSRPSSRRPSLAATRITSPIRATTSTWLSSASTKTASRCTARTS